jgi:glycosyltransferase involved in cell wall biosynthesis
MKINILFEFKDGPWGGGNQFLKSLKKELTKRNIYEESTDKSDVIIYNNYHNILRAILMKIRFPDKIFIHRLGPYFYLHRGRKWKIIDSLIIEVSNIVSDLIVFQSNWSCKKAMSEFNLDKNKKYSIIGNSADSNIFYPKNNSPKRDKIKLISDGWSSNDKKGGKYYEFLDNNLDFSRYEMIFVGNSKIRFKNIKLLGPLPSDKLAEEIRKNDIFISAVEDDACSNTIIEALSCGLPVVALKSGGNAEIIKNGGELFDTNEEMLKKIDMVNNDYLKYKNDIKIDSTEDSADKYLDAIKKADITKQKNNTCNKIKLFYLYTKTCLIIFIFKVF